MRNQDWIDRAARVMPGRQSNARALDEPSIFIDRGERQTIWDVEGKDYFDFALAMGPGIWGNANADYLAAIHQQLDRPRRSRIKRDLRLDHEQVHLVELRSAVRRDLAKPLVVSIVKPDREVGLDHLEAIEDATADIA